MSFFTTSTLTNPTVPLSLFIWNNKELTGHDKYLARIYSIVGNSYIFGILFPFWLFFVFLQKDAVELEEEPYWIDYLGLVLTPVATAPGLLSIDTFIKFGHLSFDIHVATEAVMILTCIGAPSWNRLGSEVSERFDVET